MVLPSQQWQKKENKKIQKKERINNEQETTQEYLWHKEAAVTTL